MNNQKAKDLIQ